MQEARHPMVRMVTFWPDGEFKVCPKDCDMSCIQMKNTGFPRGKVRQLHFPKSISGQSGIYMSDLGYLGLDHTHFLININIGPHSRTKKHMI